MIIQTINDENVIVEDVNEENVPCFIRDNLVTKTSKFQQEVETLCELNEHNPYLFYKQNHISFLHNALGKLPPGFVSLDASRPWIFYWVFNSLSLLGEDTSELNNRLIETIFNIQSFDDSAFGGGFGHIPHLATSYASINSLIITCDESAWNKIDRLGIYNWLLRLKSPAGAFAMNINGEIDIRATYCALSIASLLNILTPELTKNVFSWISLCQTYEGGVGAFPGSEAHGGYTFCALAALAILGPPKETFHKYLNMQSLLRWLTLRQYQIEGGLSGRTNKLVDGCYSWWIGGCWPLINMALKKNTNIWNKERLCDYIIKNCQATKGGLRDKPGKPADFYHTCYIISGLSACLNNDISESQDTDTINIPVDSDSEKKQTLKLNEIDPIHVIDSRCVQKCKSFFKDKKIN